MVIFTPHKSFAMARSKAAAVKNASAARAAAEGKAAAPPPAGKAKRRRGRLWRTNWLRECKAMQRATDNLVPFKSMSDLFREVAQGIIGESGSVRWNKEALKLLQAESEQFMTELFERANNYVVNSKRVTLRSCDVLSAHRDMQREARRLATLI